MEDDSDAAVALPSWLTKHLKDVHKNVADGVYTAKDGETMEKLLKRRHLAAARRMAKLGKAGSSRGCPIRGGLSSLDFGVYGKKHELQAIPAPGADSPPSPRNELR